MKNVFTLLLIVLSISVTAQVQYQWHYHVPTTDTGSSSAVAIDHGDSNYVYVCAVSPPGMDLDLSPTWHVATAPAYITVYNPLGNYVRSWCISAWFLDMCVATNGDVLIAGQFTGTVDFDPTAGVHNLSSPSVYTSFIARYTKYGQLIWVQDFDQTTQGELVVLNVDENAGMMVVSGSIVCWVNQPLDLDPGIGTSNYTSYNVYSAFVVRFNPNGTFAWALSDPAIATRHVAVNAAGEIACTGYAAGTVDFDPGPGTASYTSLASSGDFFVARYNSMGDYVWHYATGTTSWYGNGGYVKLNNGGEIVVTGSCFSLIDLDPGSGTSMVNASGYFTAKYSSAGNLDWAVDGGNWVETDAIGNVYVSSSTGLRCISPSGMVYWNTPVGHDALFSVGSNARINLMWWGHPAEDVDPGAGTITVPVVGHYVLCCLSDLVSGTEEITGNKLTLYPNPASDALFIETGDLNTLDYSILNAAGQRVLTGTLSAGRSQIDVSGLSSGIYFFSLQEDGLVRKFVVRH